MEKGLSMRRMLIERNSKLNLFEMNFIKMEISTNFGLQYLGFFICYVTYDKYFFRPTGGFLNHSSQINSIYHQKTENIYVDRNFCILECFLPLQRSFTKRTGMIINLKNIFYLPRLFSHNVGLV